MQTAHAQSPWPRWFEPLLMMSLALPAAAPAAEIAAPSLEKDEKKWIEHVRLILTTREKELFAGLRTKADRDEFRRLFWARRDPDLSTPNNELEAFYEAHRRQAAKLYDCAHPLQRFEHTPPAATDCALVHLALGPPAETSPVEGRPKSGVCDWRRWRYPGGLDFEFNSRCLFPDYGMERRRDALRSLLVAQPHLEYVVEDGKLVKTLDDLMPVRAAAPPPARESAPPLQIQAAFLKAEDGATRVLALVRGEAEATRDPAPEPPTPLVLRAQAVRGDGLLVASRQREIAAVVGADGSVLGSFFMTVRPGRHALKVTLHRHGDAAASTVVETIEVPDLNKGRLSIGSLLLLEGIDKAPSDVGHPLTAFTFGRSLFVPRFGHVFGPDQSLTAVFQLHDARVDATSGKAATTAKLAITRENGDVVAEGPEETFDSAIAGGMLGPVSLRNYEPGTYTVRLTAVDKIANTTEVQQTHFQVKAR